MGSLLTATAVGRSSGYFNPLVVVAELVDAPGLGSGVLRRGGSSPLSDTLGN